MGRTSQAPGSNELGRGSVRVLASRVEIQPELIQSGRRLRWLVVAKKDGVLQAVALSGLRKSAL